MDGGAPGADVPRPKDDVADVLATAGALTASSNAGGVPVVSGAQPEGGHHAQSEASQSGGIPGGSATASAEVAGTAAGSASSTSSTSTSTSTSASTSTSTSTSTSSEPLSYDDAKLHLLDAIRSGIQQRQTFRRAKFRHYQEFHSKFVGTDEKHLKARAVVQRGIKEVRARPSVRPLRSGIHHRFIRQPNATSSITRGASAAHISARSRVGTISASLLTISSSVHRRVPADCPLICSLVCLLLTCHLRTHAAFAHARAGNGRTRTDGLGR
jgi:hypothetical protein